MTETNTRSKVHPEEINITHLVEDFDTLHLLSGSVAEHGANAGQFTWKNAQAYSEIHPLVDCDERREAIRRWAASFGAWDDEEIHEWDDQELTALLSQAVAADLREIEEFWDGDSINWDRVEQEQEAGRFSSRIWPGIDGEIYYYIGE